MIEINKYHIGDSCLRYYSPWAGQKLHPFTWQGSYQIADVDMDGLIVLLHDVTGKRNTWIRVSALKPVIKTHCGKLLQQNEDGRWQDVLEESPPNDSPVVAALSSGLPFQRSLAKRRS